MVGKDGPDQVISASDARSAGRARGLRRCVRLDGAGGCQNAVATFSERGCQHSTKDAGTGAARGAAEGISRGHRTWRTSATALTLQRARSLESEIRSAHAAGSLLSIPADSVMGKARRADRAVTDSALDLAWPASRLAAANYRYSWQAPIRPNCTILPAIQFCATALRSGTCGRKPWRRRGVQPGRRSRCGSPSTTTWRTPKRRSHPTPFHPPTGRRVRGRPVVAGSAFIAKLVGEQTVREWAGPQRSRPCSAFPETKTFSPPNGLSRSTKTLQPSTTSRSAAPPVFLYYTNPPRPLPPATRNEGIHNYRFGLVLKQRMNQLGIECVLSHAGQYAPQDRSVKMHQEMVDFFVKHFPQP